MFVFKGTAAADASNEREWRVGDHYNIQNLGRRPFNMMLQPSLHHRSMTEDARRPSPPPSRSRSNSSFAIHPLYEGIKLSPSPSIDRSTPGFAAESRSSSISSIHKRGTSSEGFGKSLMAKGSKFLRRQNSKQDQDNDLTSLHTLEWLEAINQTENAQGLSDRPTHSPTRSPGEGECNYLLLTLDYR